MPGTRLKNAAKALLGHRAAAAVSRFAATHAIRRALAVLDRRADPLTADAVVDLLYSHAFRHLRPWQQRDELLELAREIERRRPRTVLEIGTAAGGTLLLAACLADADARIHSIDLPHGPFGGGYPDWKTPLYAAFARQRQRIELIRGDSHSPVVFERLQALLDGRRVDHLFIDADHSYAGVRQDFEMYRELLADGALVAFHDINEDASAPGRRTVADYWREIRDRYAYREFIRHPEQNACGIGVFEYRHAGAEQLADSTA